MAKGRIKKYDKGKPPKRGFPWFVWLGISLGIIIIAAVVFILTRPAAEILVEPYTGALKAAIVDQLYNRRENQAFIELTTSDLEDYGFEVDIYQGDIINVDFYQQLPTGGYKLIIFRVHSGLLENQQSVGDKTWMFTNEHYSRMKHFFKQMRGQVTHATTEPDEPTIFAVGTKFINECMEENFNDTVVILMGCAAFRSEDLAEAFINNGASAYIAWDASVGLQYVDDATITLIDKLCVKEIPVAQAVEETMDEHGIDPVGNAVLKYYPQTVADKTLKQLIE